MIGINSQIETGGGGSDGNIGIGFAMPINTAKAELPELEKDGTVQDRLPRRRDDHDRRLALQPQPAGQERRAGREASKPARRAEKAGIRGGNVEAKVGGSEISVGGDIIVGIDGKQVDELRSLAAPSAPRSPATPSRSNCCAPVGQRRLQQEERHGHARPAAQLDPEPQHAGIACAAAGSRRQ